MFAQKGILLGGLEQKLGRYAPTVEARAAELSFLQQGHLGSQLGGSDGGRVSSRASAYHHNMMSFPCFLHHLWATFPIQQEPNAIPWG
jgi:hypothetical protein